MLAQLRLRYLTVVGYCGEILPIPINIMAPSLSLGAGARKKKTSIANNGSTASSPSLRSKTPVVVDDGRPSSSGGPPGGNVKVVVRVRAFLPRGTPQRPSLHACASTDCVLQNWKEEQSA